MRASTFFEGVKQVETSLREHAFKVPVFYYDGSSITGVFAARLSVLRKLVPDRRFNPARLAPGVGTVTITCFEYKDTDIGPYNELAISIPLNEPYFRPNLPGRALLEAQRSGQFHAWVHHLPVTTEIACVGGVEYYNYPKFVASIDYEEAKGRRSCRLAEGEEHILTLTCGAKPGKIDREVQIFSHLWMDRQPQSSEFKIHLSGMRPTVGPGRGGLELGTQHPIARELASALISRTPIATSYVPQMEGILYGPEHFTLPNVDGVLRENYLEPGKATVA